MAAKSLQQKFISNFDPEELIMVAQIRLELLRFAMALSGGSGKDEVISTVKTLDAFCFDVEIMKDATRFEFRTEGNA